MLDCILIDDEKPALRELEYLLAAHADCLRVTGCFHRVNDLLAALETLNPAVAFIDMHMPVLHGLELSRVLRERLPGILLVFVTAHAQYAVDAFGEEALDYLLKPVTPERLANTVERLSRRKGSRENPPDAASCAVRIHVFGGLRVETPGGLLRWHSAKTRELFAYLLHHRTLTLSRDQVLDELYADSAPERASQRLYNDHYQIRRQLHACGIAASSLRIELCRLHLGTDDVFCDIDQYERLLSAKTEENAQVLRHTAGLVNGHYLQDADWPWAQARRESLRTRQQRLLCQLAEFDRKAGRIAEAEAVLLRALENDPCDEDAVSGLIRLYVQNGRHTQARRQYEAYKERLMNDLQLTPGWALQTLMLQVSGG